MLVLVATEVEKIFASVGDVGAQIIGANIWTQPYALNPKARFIMKLKNTARSRRSRRLLETGATDVADNESSVMSFNKLGIVYKSRDLKAADAL